MILMDWYSAFATLSVFFFVDFIVLYIFCSCYEWWSFYHTDNLLCHLNYHDHIVFSIPYYRQQKYRAKKMAFFKGHVSVAETAVEVFHLRPAIQFILDRAESGGTTGEAKSGFGTDLELAHLREHHPKYSLYYIYIYTMYVCIYMYILYSWNQQPRFRSLTSRDTGTTWWPSDVHLRKHDGDPWTWGGCWKGKAHVKHMPYCLND